MKRREGVGVFWRKLRRVRVARTDGAAFAGLAILAGFGCEAGPAPTSTSRDNLGVSIVESVVPRWDEGAAWRIEEEPVVDLAATGSGEMHTFFRVRDVLRASGDHLVVADWASQQVRVYDSVGRFVRVFGGPGEGPGEFRFLWAVVLKPDGRLVATDFSLGGGAEFDIDSGLVATFRLPQRVYPIRQTVPSDIVWGLDQGAAMDREGLGEGLQRPLATIVRLSEDRMSVDSIASVPGDEVVIVPEGDAIPLMGRWTHVVPTGDGEVILGTSDALEYSMLDGRTGEVRLIARILGVPLTVSREEVEHEKRVRLGDPSPFRRDILARLPTPAEKPAYQRMIVDVDGNVWAGEFLGLARRDEPQVWYVWDSSGAWLGTVETPARFELMRVGGDEAFGVRRDLNEVESPQVLRLVKYD